MILLRADEGEGLMQNVSLSIWIVHSPVMFSQAICD